MGISYTRMGNIMSLPGPPVQSFVLVKLTATVLLLWQVKEAEMVRISWNHWWRGGWGDNFYRMHLT